MHVGHGYGAKQLEFAKPRGNGSTASQVHCGPPTLQLLLNLFLSLWFCRFLFGVKLKQSRQLVASHLSHACNCTRVL